jgi:hypothetical protein
MAHGYTGGSRYQPVFSSQVPTRQARECGKQVRWLALESFPPKRGEPRRVPTSSHGLQGFVICNSCPGASRREAVGGLIGPNSASGARGSPRDHLLKDPNGWMPLLRRVVTKNVSAFRLGAGTISDRISQRKAPRDPSQVAATGPYLLPRRSRKLDHKTGADSLRPRTLEAHVGRFGDDRSHRGQHGIELSARSLSSPTESDRAYAMHARSRESIRRARRE